MLKNITSPTKLEQFQNALRLLPDNESCHKYNIEQIIKLKTPITKLLNVNSPMRGRNYSDDNFYGLSNLHYINAKKTLTNNFWTKKGFVNGANAYIRDIVFLPNQKTICLMQSLWNLNIIVDLNFFQLDTQRKIGYQ